MNWYKNRTIEENKRVKVYFNLHKNLFSVVALEGEFKNKVIAHTEEISLKNCELKVNEKGRQRVLKEKKKNVHAYVYGILINEKPEFKKEIYYNPYITDVFLDERKKPVYKKDKIYLKNKKIYY